MTRLSRLLEIFNDATGTKNYLKGAVCKIYLPPEEMWAVARDVQMLTEEHEDGLLRCFSNV